MRIEQFSLAPVALFVLLDACAAPRLDDLTKGRPLLNAAIHCDLERLNALLSSGSDVNSSDDNGMTALHWASHEFVRWGDSKHQASCIRTLIAHGANVNAKSKQGETPLELGSWSVDCVRILLAARAQVNTADIFGHTPVFRVAQERSVEAITLLLDAKADPNVCDSIGWTPLMAAVIHGTPETVTALLHAGARINTKNHFGATALKALKTARRPGLFAQLINPSERSYVLEREEIARILRAAGGTE